MRSELELPFLRLSVLTSQPTQPSGGTLGYDRNLPRHREAWRAMLLVALCTLFYWPSLKFGYFYDDFWILQQSLLGADPMHLARPAWLISTVGLAQLSTDPFFQRLVSLVCFDVLAILCLPLFRSTPYPLLLSLVLLSHPWFVYPVTWISQRADLLWLIFVALAVLSRSAFGATLWGMLSLISKTPFILHGLVLSGHFRQRKWPVASAVLVVTFLVVAVVSYFLVLSQHVIADQTAAGGFHSLKHSFSSTWGLFGAMLLAGLAKIVESVVLIFVPFPATYGTGIISWAIVIGYLAAWAAAFNLLFRAKFVGVNILWLLIGSAAAMSFAFTAQLRAIAPAGFFVVAALLAGMPSTRRSALVLSSILALNVWSSVALYKATDTGCYDLHQPGAYEVCREGANLPYRHWGEYRHDKTDEIAEVLKEVLGRH